MHPVLIDFGFFKLHTYGLMIAIAFFVGMQLGAREAKRVDLSPKQDFPVFINDLVFWILPVSIAGSRILFIIVNWGSDYSRDPMKIFRIWEGGLVFYGGFISAVLFSWYYARKRERSFLQVADILIPSVALGHFFGRLGCFAAGCCWGHVADPSFPFAVQFPAGSLIHSSMRASGQIGAEEWTLHVHPTQLYESFGELMIFFVLLAVRMRKRFHGQVLLTYLFLYPILRTSLEFVRGDKERGIVDFGFVQLSTSQIISIGVALAAVSLMTYVIRRRGAVTPTGASPA